MYWSIVIIALCTLTVSAIPVKDAEQAQLRLHGENGWYVPQVDGTMKWLSTAEGEALLEDYEAADHVAKAGDNERLLWNAVDFYLYTRANLDDAQEISTSSATITASNFNASNPTRFTIHGWNANYQDGMSSGLGEVLFPQGDFNSIAVDWSRARSLDYASSVAGMKASGKKIAELIDLLVTEHGLLLSTVELIGISLGAHVAGHAAKQVTTGDVQTIIGLDPASPLISYDKPEKRLASDDALYVESIQTNCGVLGFTRPIGSATFYPNGGQTQPGCIGDITGFCSHGRSFTYYLEALELNNFSAIECASYLEATDKNCGSTFSSVRLGAKQNHNQANGVFYVPLNEESPYGLGV